MSKRKIKKPKNCNCSQCGKEYGILNVSMPSNRFLMPRTEEQSKALDDAVKNKTVTPEMMWKDKHDRKIRLCPLCLSVVQAKLGNDVRKW